MTRHGGVHTTLAIISEPRVSRLRSLLRVHLPLSRGCVCRSRTQHPAKAVPLFHLREPGHTPHLLLPKPGCFLEQLPSSLGLSQACSWQHPAHCCLTSMESGLRAPGLAGEPVRGGLCSQQAPTSDRNDRQPEKSQRRVRK